MAPSPVSDTKPAWRDVLTAAILIPILIIAVAVVARFTIACSANCHWMCAHRTCQCRCHQPAEAEDP